MAVLRTSSRHLNPIRSRQRFQAVRCGVFVCAVLLLAVVAPALAREPLKGMALVIGQSKYQHLPALLNPGNDARAMADLFTDLGFDVTATSNRDARRLKRDLENFAFDAQGADVAVVYYSGHGIEAGGENWLVPVDADASSLDTAENNLVALSDPLDDLRANLPLTLFFLDACRTNPFPPGTLLKLDGKRLPVSAGGLSLTKGAIPAEPDSGTLGLGSLIGFAAEPGMVALDGPPDGNSPYAAALLRHLSASAGLEFGTVMRLVTEEVYLKTQGRQRPWVNETLTKLLYFGGKPENTASDDGRLNEGRRALLLSIDSLDASMRYTVERLARKNGLPLDPLYGMLKELKVDPSAGPEELDRQLRAGVEAVKELREARDTITRTDPEIIRYTDLADRAEAEGAIPLAQDYRARASARAAEISKLLKAEDQNLKARHLEVAATFAREAETAVLAFNHRKAAEKYAIAFAEVQNHDLKLALDYKWKEAGALRDDGQYKGDFESLTAAVAAYDHAIQMVSKTESRVDWGDLQNDLGNTLELLGERQSDSTRLFEAIEAFRAALTVRTREAAPLSWANTQNDLGVALYRLGEREIGTQRLREAADVFRTTLDLRHRKDVPLDWAQTQNNLGLVLYTLAERQGDADLMLEAIAAYRAALLEYSRGDTPMDWAMTQNNLGNALSSLGEITNDNSKLEDSVVAYWAALEVRTRDKLPLQWAQTLNNLAISLEQLGERTNDTARLREAIATYRSTLDVFTRERMPVEWTRVQNNLGLALAVLGQTEADAGLLEEAVSAYRASLEERRRENVPLDWAQTQDNLARALGLIAELSTGEARKTAWRGAIEASRAALPVYRRDERPHVWSRLLNQIGYYTVRLGEEENRAERYEEAIPLLREALAVQKKLAHDQTALTADSLCRALLDLGVSRKIRNHVREAEVHCRFALAGERSLANAAAIKETEGNLARIRAALKDLR